MDDEDPWCQNARLKEQYRRLKEEHQHLLLDKGNIEIEHKKVLDDFESTRAECAKQIEALQLKNKETERELFLLRPHVITAEAEELIKIKATEELEKRCNEELRGYMTQLEALTIECNAYRRENDFLKGELLSLSESAERAKVEYRQRLDAETAALQRQRDILATEDKTKVSDAVRRSHQLDLDNKQLSLKMNSILKENEELTTSYQKLQAEYNTMSRESAKKIANLNGQLSALIVEKDCCRNQSDILSREIASLSESNVRLTTRVHDLEQRNGRLQAEIDNLTHNHLMELNQTKLQYMNDRTGMERERAEMRLLFKECEAERESLRHVLDQKAEQLINKERHCEERISAIKQEAHEIRLGLENKVSDLDGKLAESERKIRHLEDLLESMKKNHAARIEQLLGEKNSLLVEINSLKAELDRLRGQPPVVINGGSGDRPPPPPPPPTRQCDCENLKKKIQTLKDKLRAAKHRIHDLQDSANSFNATIKKLEEKNAKFRSWMDDFCRSHGRFSKTLEANDEYWNKENVLDCGPCYNGDVLNMFRTVNEKLAAIEQRTVRQLGVSHAQASTLSNDGLVPNNDVPKSEFASRNDGSIA